MTKLLQQAIAEVEKLPEAAQDMIASLILAEIDDERRWDEQFAKSHDQLARLVAKALDEHRAGLTIPLDPDRLP